MNQALQNFITQARAAGQSVTDIRTALMQAGWGSPDIDAGLGVSTNLVAPPAPGIPNHKSSGKEIFFHLLSFLGLKITGFSLGAIAFQLINRYFSPEVINQFAYQSNGLRWALASFIVVAPVYFLVMRKIVKDTDTGAMNSQSRIRKALTYIALFIACALLAGDLITLVFRFVAGETNIRFLLKVLVILVLGGWTLWYYWTGIKHTEAGLGVADKKSWHLGHAWAFMVVSTVALVVGFLLVGNPRNQQMVVRDNNRVQTLQQLSYMINSDYQGVVKDAPTTRQLPSNLNEIGQGGIGLTYKDPLTGTPYEYVPSSGSSYKLCATFETNSSSDNRGLINPTTLNWSHTAGRYCFTIDAAKNIY